MNNRRENQITMKLREMKKQKWQVALLVCLSLLVAAGVAGIFHLPATTKTYQVRELTCTAVPPTGAACADFFVHIHNDDCYDGDGHLVCPLPEIKPHRHTEDCYSSSRVLACSLPESDGHQHTADCYTSVRGDLICELSTEPVLDEEGNVLEGGHVHTDECYEWDDELCCGMEEGQGAHHHDDSCYQTETTLTCDKPEIILHTHTDDCYLKDEDGDIYVDENGDMWLICGQVQVVEHVHGPECFTVHELDEEPDETDPESAAPGQFFFMDEENEDETEETDGTKQDEAGETSETIDEAGQTEEGTGEETEPADGKTGEESPEVPLSVRMPAQNFEESTDTVTVRVVAPDGAFPPDTTMRVTQIEIESVMGVVQESVGGEITRVQAVDISFFDADGNEIEPVVPIHVDMIPVADSGNGETEEAAAAPDGSVQTILHMDNNGNTTVVEQKEGDGTENSTVSFAADSFSVYILVYSNTLEKTVLASDGETYRITLSYDADAGIPADAELAVEEILPDSEEYKAYLEMAENSVENEMVSFARFFDITILSGGQEIQPAAPVDVKIELADTLEDGAKAIHFGEEVEVIDAEVTSLPEKTTDAGMAESAGSETAFSAEGFSVYGVIVTTLEKTITASDGNTYNVSVTYGADAKIPVDAVLSVEEILSESERYNDYVNETETVLGLEAGSLPYARFFDITILGAEEEKLQPAEGTTVEVRIELADVEDGKSLNIVHFAESQGEDKTEPELLESVTEGAAVSFRTSGFSVYAVAENVDLEALNNKTYGLINTTDGAKPSGVAMMSTAQSNGTKLPGKTTTVRINTVNRRDYVYVANDSNITMWTFYEASEEGKYYITTQAGGQTKYLNVSSNGISLIDDSSEAGCVFTVSAGTGTNAGKYKFSTTNGVLRLNGSNFERAGTSYKSADAWMNFAELSDLNEDDFVTYTAQKVSISEAAGEVNDGDMVILYTRIWNDKDHRYDYYVVDYDGKLVKAYESGDTISWVGSQVNTMLWDFKEHYYAGTDTPNGYYDLSNSYSGKYIAPKTSNGTETFFADSAYGVNLNGRGNGDYYTTILAWDDYYYASLKVDEEQIELLSSTLSQASDFYFAKMSTDTATMEVTTVSTVNNNEHGITLKMQDFGENDNLSDGRSEEMDNILGKTSYVQWEGTKNLVQNYIAEGSAYPRATYSNKKSLGELFSNPMLVNNQFLTTTYYETGYFEYDSTKNFAHLITSTSDPWYDLVAPNGTKYDIGDFVIYGQLGTSSEGNKDTLRHGQFLPYNDIIEGFETDEEGNLILDENGNPIPMPIKISKQYHNTHDIHATPLSSLDPAYGEDLYEIQFNKSTHSLPDVDHFFGMEMSASFMQSASGLDAWGHDLIFEFSGDDDFWLYVDDVLVLDLGGIHSALDGNVNFRTGEIVENGRPFTLKERFEAAYRAQHAGEANLEQNLQNWLKGIFKVETVIENGEETEKITSVFKDYSSHTMRMFYLERGAGASNIHMRFNISEYKDGGIQLQKKVSGTENSDQLFPFQIWYEDEHANVMVRADQSKAVTDSQTGEQVPYEAEYSVQAEDNTLVYKDVFFLKAGQTVNIQLPSEDTPYYIRECAMDSPATYKWVKINDIETDGSKVSPQKINVDYVTGDTVIPDNTGLLDFNAAQATVSERKKVIYENHVDETAMKNLTIKKRLWQDEDMTKPIDADNTEFSFRVYIGMEGGTYTIYKNGPYRVKNPAGEYCYFHNGAFVSTGKTVFGEITDDIVHNDPQILLGDTLQQRCTFHTGRGSVSRIKAGYIVEIPGLLNGTPFIVAERDDEIPSGYNRLGYEANGSGFVVPGELLTGTTEDREAGLLMAGTINGDQAVTVHNQHGYTLIAKKVWSDAAFMENHDEIYFAVYLKDDSGALSLIDGSVRQLGKTGTSLSWFFPDLEEGKNLNYYVVYEVMLKVPEGSSLVVDSSGKVTGYTTVSGDTTAITEENLIRIKEGNVLTAGGRSNEHGYSASMEYVANYSREVLEPGTDGKYPNVRTDTVSNSRPGIKIVKTDINGVPLEGAGFTFSNQNSLTKTFSSDQNGLVVVAYLLPDKDYLLTESDAPYGYRSLIDSLTIRVDGDGTVYVNGLATDPENGSYTITQVQNWTAANMPTVTIRNQGFALKAVKIDSASGRPLSGVKFALYKEVFASTNGIPDQTRPMPDYTPMEGYEALITDEAGVIPRIVLKNAENPDGLPAGHYYLREVETPAGYVSLGMDIRINLSSSGQVTIQSAERTAAGEDWLIDDVSSDIAEIKSISDSLLQITLKNTPKDPVRIKKVEMLSGKTLTGVKFELYRSNQVDEEDGLPKPGETPVIEGTTDANGILTLGGLEGMYFLFETETLPGYNLLSGAIQINVSADSNNVTAYQIGHGPLTPKKVKDNAGKDVWEITVENSTGYELPQTGGEGTLLFSVFGTILILTSTLFILAKRKREAYVPRH